MDNLDIKVLSGPRTTKGYGVGVWDVSLNGEEATVTMSNGDLKFYSALPKAAQGDVQFRKAVKEEVLKAIEQYAQTPASKGSGKWDLNGREIPANESIFDNLVDSVLITEKKKKTGMFAKIEKAAEKEYGSKKIALKVAGAIKAKQSKKK
jgi:hypothetical protein